MDFEQELAKLTEAMEQTAVQFDRDLDGWLRSLEPTLEPILSTVEVWQQQVNDHVAEALGSVEATLVCPEPCRGCRYYHGRSYHDQTLICALHPEGPVHASCRDYAAWWER